MPTYGYRCTACNQEFERFQKISDPALTECEGCGGALKKLIYPAGIQFKGSGFHVNDYAKKSSGGSSEGNGSSAASDSASPPSAPATPSAPSTPSPAPAPAGGTASS